MLFGIRIPAVWGSGCFVSESANQAADIAAVFADKANNFSQSHCQKEPENQQGTDILQQPTVGINNQYNQNHAYG